jgi:hypothetical protein
VAVAPDGAVNARADDGVVEIRIAPDGAAGKPWATALWKMQ